MTGSLLGALGMIARRYGRPIVADPKGSAHSKYRGMDVLTPNLRELEMMHDHRVASEEDLRRAARRLIKSVGLKALVV